MKLRALLLLMLAAAFITCKPDKEEIIETDEVSYDGTAFELIYPNHFPAPSLPADNPLTVQGVKLGKMIFHETMLSGDNTQSCADCHLQQFAFTDSARFSIGIAGLPGGRQAMSVFNMAWNEQGFFWDGRAPQLRDQSLMPIQDPLEMNETLENVVTKLGDSQTYRDQFVRAFGSETITSERISLAMEQFMFSIVSSNSKYDEFLEGTAELTESEERGRALFFAEYNPFFPEDSGADCAHCHSGANFENDQFMNNGLDA
ncbi:MAG: cytochrome-c peroxidase, partial [Flavobacteriales bacterium]